MNIGAGVSENTQTHIYYFFLLTFISSINNRLDGNNGFYFESFTTNLCLPNKFSRGDFITLLKEQNTLPFVAYDTNSNTSLVLGHQIYGTTSGLFSQYYLQGVKLAYLMLLVEVFGMKGSIAMVCLCKSSQHN